MTDSNGPDDGRMGAFHLPENLAARLRWKFWEFFRRYFPMTPEESAKRLEAWRRQAGRPQPDRNGQDAVANRCCVMRIPGVGTRCSSEPLNENQCRELAGQYNGTGHFYPDRPCIDCTPLP